MVCQAEEVLTSNIEVLLCLCSQAPDADVETAVRLALDLGYRLIDTAWFYGNEAGVGAAVRGKIQEGAVKRENICVTTKVSVLLKSAFYRSANISSH